MKSIICVVPTDDIDNFTKVEKKINKELKKLKLKIDGGGYNLLTGQRDFSVYIEDNQDKCAKDAKKSIQSILKKEKIKPDMLCISDGD